MPEPIEQAPRRTPAGRAWAELTGAWALAIAWQMFQGASSGPDALALLRADRIDILVFSAILILIGPTVLWLIELTLNRFSPVAGRWFHAACLGVLFGLVIWQGIHGTVGAVLGYLVLATAAALITVLYVKTDFVRTMAGLMAFATPVVVLAFWFTGPTVSVMLPHDSPTVTGEGNGTPVVMVVLDEFPLSSIESKPGKIDSENFPNLARLSRTGTWYRNAHTVADVTNGAVPALLAGRKWESEDTPPDSHNYPDNAFTLLDEAGYDVEAEESITDLCPHDVCEDRGSLRSRISLMMINGAGNSEPIPGDVAEKLTKPLRPAAVALEPSPRDRADTFIDRLPTGRDRFSFVHLLLPHIPWIYLPNGQDYPAPIAPGLFDIPGPNLDESWDGTFGQVKSAFQRMQLQTSFADHEIGRLIARMKKQGDWDDALFVVVADHGGSFQAGYDRRYLNPKNAGWIMPVPLFVKYPGQTRGKPVDTPVNSLDLLPTILAETGVDAPDGLDGEPLDEVRPSDEALGSFSSTQGDFTISRAELKDRFDAAVEYRNQVFPDGNLYSLAGRGDQFGQPVEEAINLTPIDVTFDSPWPDAIVDAEGDQIPAYVTGIIQTPVEDDTPLAISLNRKIAGTMNSWMEAGVRRFQFTLPPEFFVQGNNHLEMFQIAE